MRLIDADALKNMRFSCGMLDDNHVIYAPIREVFKNIDKAPTIGGWISVKDRLPDDASDVIAYYGCGDSGHVIFVNYYKNCWYDVFNDLIDDLEQGCITHWMSLPEPPSDCQ